MASFTTRLNLRKPAATDHPDPVLDIAANMDLLDAHTHSGTYEPLGGVATEAAARAAADATKVALDTLVWNVKDHGAVGNGIADDRAAINATIVLANAAGGGRVLLPAGNYSVASSPGITLLANVHLDFAPGAYITQGYWPGVFTGLISASGTYTDANVTGAVLTANAAAGATTLTMTSTANLTAGSYYLLGADRAYVNSPVSTSNDQLRYRGEVVRVKSIDSGTVVTIYGFVQDAYATADAASLKAITFLDGARISNPRIVNPAPGAHTSDFIKLSYCRDFAIENVHLESGDGCGIHLDMCIDGRIQGGRIIDLTDDTANDRYGYGVNVNRATQNVSISGLNVRRGRHAFTTNGVDNKRGVPRNIVISGCTSENSNDSAWDTHAQGAAITFTGCSAVGAKTNGYNVRATDTRILGCSAAYCAVGLNLSSPAYGATIKGNSFRHMTSASGHGITLGGAQQCQIVDNVVDGTYLFSMFITGGATNNLVAGNKFLNPGQQASETAGIRVDSASTGTGNRIINNFFGRIGAATDEAGSTGLLGFPVEIEPTGTLSYLITGNRSHGAAQATFVSDAAVGNVKFDNQQLDRGFDPIGFGQPVTMPPWNNLTASAPGDKTCRYFRVLGGGQITKIGMIIGTQSGNVTVGVYSASGVGKAAVPAIRKATSGSVACPASGYAEVALGSTVTVNEGDYFAVVFDNGTATLQISNAFPTSVAISDGWQWGQTLASFVLPTTPASLVSVTGRTAYLVGVA